MQINFTMNIKPKELLSESAKKMAKNIKVDYFDDKEKYTKRQFAQIYKGYDFLENMLVVRTYIQRYYDIDFPTLELLLKLMGMKIFTMADYQRLPKQFSLFKFKRALNDDLVVLLADNKQVQYRLYTLSTRSKNICVKFYQLLSGEEKIPESGSKNPMANSSSQTKFDKKKMDMVKLINQLPVKDHNKTLF
jgi:hypothetical protein